MTKEEKILIMLRQQKKVREIKEELHTGAKKISEVRLKHQHAFPEIKIKKRTGTIKRTELRTRTKYKKEDETIFTKIPLFTEREKTLTRKMFRAVIRQRAIKITEEEEYQNLIDKIIGD